jgi:hypothetical protein
MKSQLEALQPILVSTVKETNELLDRINSDKKEAEKTRGIVEAEEAVVNVKATEAKAIRQDCEAELAVVSTTSNYFFAVILLMCTSDIEHEEMHCHLYIDDLPMA